MGNRFISTFAALVLVSVSTAPGVRTQVDLRVHAAGICWEPDVEFPVPCDDDDD